MDSDSSTPLPPPGPPPAPPSEAAPRRVPRRDILSVKFACGVCTQHIEAPRDCFGEVMPCPVCGTLHQIPDVKDAPRSFPVRRFARP